MNYSNKIINEIINTNNNIITLLDFQTNNIKKKILNDSIINYLNKYTIKNILEIYYNYGINGLLDKKTFILFFNKLTNNNDNALIYYNIFQKKNMVDYKSFIIGISLLIKISYNDKINQLKSLFENINSNLLDIALINHYLSIYFNLYNLYKPHNTLIINNIKNKVYLYLNKKSNLDINSFINLLEYLFILFDL